jgi:lipopolysaccharide biosynthesis regulator YciM
MQDYGLLFMLLALLVGLAGGKAWERYKLVEGRWIDRRRVRQSPHFILGLNYLVGAQVDLAIEELEKAANLDPGAWSCGSCSETCTARKARWAGRFTNIRPAPAAAPQSHRARQRSALPGLDYRRGGFVDRAVAAFTDVLKLDPNNEAALVNLEKLQEDQHQWQEAYVTRQRLSQLAGPRDSPSRSPFWRSSRTKSACRR